MALAHALITTAEAKAFITPAPPVGDDGLIEALIDAATESIETWLQGTLVVKRTIVEEIQVPRQGYPRLFGMRRHLYLKRRPIVSITSIADPSGYAVPATTYAIHESNGMLLLNQSWQPPREVAGQPSFYTLTYIAGMVENTAAVPARFKQAAKFTVARYYANSVRSSQGTVRARRVGDLSIEYSDSSQAQSTIDATGAEMPPEVYALLAGDRSRWC